MGGGVAEKSHGGIRFEEYSVGEQRYLRNLLKDKSTEDGQSGLFLMLLAGQGSENETNYLSLKYLNHK